MNRMQALLRVTGTPQAILPDKAAVIAAVLAERNGSDVSFTLDGNPFEPEANSSDERMKRRAHAWYEGEPFQLIGGVAMIEVTGTLLHRYGSINPSSGATGYDGLTAQVDAALRHPDVKGILLDIDSPGGEVSGCFDFCERLRSAREEKPIIAMVDDLAASAAYAIASQAHEIYTSQTARVGSVGVITSHVDLSGAMAEAGITVTLLTSGARKADGNPYEALPDDVRTDIQASLDRSRALFIDHVVRGRAGSDNPIQSDALRATEARVFDPDEALKLGLIDAVAHPDGVLAAFQAQVNQPTLTNQNGAVAVNKQQRQGMKSHLAAAPTGAGTSPATASSDNDENGKDKDDEASKSKAADDDEEADEEDGNENSSGSSKKKDKAVSPSSDPLAVAQLGQSAGLPNAGFALARAGISADAAEAILAAFDQDRPATAFVDEAALRDQAQRGALAGALDTTPDPGVEADASQSADGTGASNASVHPLVKAHASLGAVQSLQRSSTRKVVSAR